LTKPCFPVFLLFAFLIINEVAGQSGTYKPGYLITTENDTIYGFIINKSWQEIVFWDSLDNKMHYGPGGTVKGFVRSGLEYVAKDLPDKKEKGFLAILEKGAITLYGIVVPESTSGNIAGCTVVGGIIGSIIATEATESSGPGSPGTKDYYGIKDFYLQKGADDKLAVAPKGNRKFNSFIIPYMRDHMDVVKSIPEEMFFPGNLISIVRQYNLVAGKR
jgi:hypothetical protein